MCALQNGHVLLFCAHFDLHGMMHPKQKECPHDKTMGCDIVEKHIVQSRVSVRRLGIVWIVRFAGGRVSERTRFKEGISGSDMI